MRSEFAYSRSVSPGFRWKTCSSALSRRLGSKARSERKDDPDRHRRSDMRRLLEQTRKELIQVFRDKRAMLFAVGLLGFSYFGYPLEGIATFTAGRNFHAPVLWYSYGDPLIVWRLPSCTDQNR